MTVAKNVELPYSSKWRFWTQRRYILVIMVFFGYLNVYSLRVNMSIGVVAMTQDRYEISPNGTKYSIGPEFNWDNRIQGYLLSSFFYGYLMTQILGGYLSKRFGGKLVFGTGIAGAALFSLLAPWFAVINVYVLLASRIVMGIFEGVSYSSLFSLWTKWIPPHERSRITSQAYSGSYAGAVFAMMFYAYLAEAAGWRSIFYFSGGLAMIWYLLWIILVSDSPETDRWISESERSYIEGSLKNSKPAPTFTVPWKQLLTSRAVWALKVAIFSETWGFYTLLTLLPKYFKEVFGYDISTSGILSALPYIFLALLLQVTGLLSDFLVRKQILSITTTRKTFTIIGFLCQACFMMGASFWSEITGTVSCLVAAVGLGSFAITIISVNSLDIAPTNSSVLFGLVNTWGTVPGIISPIVAGYLVSTENPTVAQWRIVFYIAASAYVFGALFFATFASGIRQQWDIESSNTIQEK